MFQGRNQLEVTAGTKSIRPVRENVSEATLSEESLTSNLMFLLLLKDKTNGVNFQHFFSTLKTLLCRGGRVKDGKENTSGFKHFHIVCLGVIMSLL